MTKNRNKNGIQNTKKGEFSCNQLALSNSFLEAASWCSGGRAALPSPPAWKIRPGDAKANFGTNKTFSLSLSDLCQKQDQQPQLHEVKAKTKGTHTVLR